MDQGQPYAFRMLILFALCSGFHFTDPSVPYPPVVILEPKTALYTTWTLDVLPFGTYPTEMKDRTQKKKDIQGPGIPGTGSILAPSKIWYPLISGAVIIYIQRAYDFQNYPFASARALSGGPQCEQILQEFKEACWPTWIWGLGTCKGG